MIEGYIITIKSDDNRELQDKFCRLKKLLSTVDIWKAKTPADISSTEYFHLSLHAIRERRRILSPVETASTLSHFEIMKHFISGSAKFLAVFEDDVIIPEGLGKCDIDNVINKMGPADIVIAGCQEGINNELWGQKISDNPDVFILSSFSRREVKRSTAYFCGRQAVELAIQNQINSFNFSDDFDSLGNTKGKLLFAKLFSHPIDITSSYLENQRNLADQAFLTANKPKRLIKRIFREISASITSRGFYKLIKRKTYFILKEPLNVKIRD